MTKREMLSLLIKLMGIYAIVQLVPGLVQGMLLFTHQTLTQFKHEPSMQILTVLMGMLVAPLLWLGLCIWVIRKSDTFAARLYPVDAPATQLTTLGSVDIQRLGYHFIGLLLIVKSLPAILMTLYQWTMMHRHDGPKMSGYYQWISTAVQLGIGLYLFLYPRGLANLWAKIQGKPLTEDDDYDI